MVKINIPLNLKQHPIAKNQTRTVDHEYAVNLRNGLKGLLTTEDTPNERLPRKEMRWFGYYGVNIERRKNAKTKLTVQIQPRDYIPLESDPTVVSFRFSMCGVYAFADMKSDGSIVLKKAHDEVESMEFSDEEQQVIRDEVHKMLTKTDHDALRRTDAVLRSGIRTALNGVSGTEALKMLEETLDRIE